MNDCLFCKIIKKEIPSFILYEDEIVIVFLDIKPSTNGDCLLVPKKHFDTIDKLDDNLLLHIHQVIIKMKTLLEDRLNCDGFTIAQNNGYGQEIKHFHIHLTPRYKNDCLEHSFNKDNNLDLNIVYRKITE
ncbi:MAG: HIT family protein [Bacilli bacterium]